MSSKQVRMPDAPWSAAAVEARAVSSLLPYAGNARTHPPEQVAQIAASILEFGFNVPVLVDEAGVLVAGHGRVLAAKALGLETVPAITLGHLTAAQARAFRLADNQIALNAGWDEALLAAELRDLRAEDFDLGLVGFDQAALDRLLAEAVPDGGVTPTGDPDAPAPEPPENPVSRPAGFQPPPKSLKHRTPACSEFLLRRGRHSRRGG
jgi:ParB-like chromosome segregation protein Spo0J